MAGALARLSIDSSDAALPVAGVGSLFEGVAPSSVINVPDAVFEVFGRPKGINYNRVMWTSQHESLWMELSKQDKGHGEMIVQILAGPSGIGKSHLAFLLALRAYAVGRPVLYIPDAGVFLKENAMPSQWVSALVQQHLHAGKSMTGSVSTWVDLKQLLHKYGGVVVVDEHGHAWQQMVERHETHTWLYSMLTPQGYQDVRGVRVLFAGSNQASFEAKLNGTYRPNLRFVVPMEEADARVFLREFTTWMGDAGGDDFAAVRSFTNLVPAQMVRYAASEDGDQYVTEARADMYQTLKTALDSRLEHPDLCHTLHTFFTRSMVESVAANISFLDLGFVYRDPPRGYPARPLCRPAAWALLDLWQLVSPSAERTLEQIIKLPGAEAGVPFEDLVWRTLLRGLCAELLVPTTNLAGSGTANLSWEFSDFRASSIHGNVNISNGQEQLSIEVREEASRAEARGVSTVYRCPVGCKAVDFFVFTKGLVYAVQTSVSPFADHKPDLAWLHELLPDRETTFVYITTSSKKHRNLVTREEYRGVLLVNAYEWLRSLCAVHG